MIIAFNSVKICEILYGFHLILSKTELFSNSQFFLLKYQGQLGQLARMGFHQFGACESPEEFEGPLTGPFKRSPDRRLLQSFLAFRASNSDRQAAFEPCWCCTYIVSDRTDTVHNLKPPENIGTRTNHTNNYFLKISFYHIIDRVI